MTAINETAAEVPCVRIPLQATYVSPTTPDTTIFMYSSNTDNQGNVQLHLSDVANGEEEETFTSVFAKLEQDEGSYTISYQDETNNVLQPNNIDILLGEAALQTNDDNVNTYDLFKNEVKEKPERILSPKSLVNRPERIAEYNSNTPSTTNEDVAPSTDDMKSYSDSKSPFSGKKIKLKALSPNGWGSQQCSICSKVFGNTSALAKHKLTHSDERKYGCVTCGKAFKRQDHLNGHMLTHRHKKPFECKADGCGKSYCDARSLRRHTENHHVHPSLPITTPTISVQEVISNTSTIPSCIQYAPKGTQSFQKNDISSTAIKLPKITATAVSALDQSVLLRSSQTSPRVQNGDLMKSDSEDFLTRNSVAETERLTREQFELIERIMREQGEKLKFEQNQQKSLSQQQQSQKQQRRQSTGSSHEKTSLSLSTSPSSLSSSDQSTMIANSTVKLTLTSVLLQNNNIKLLLQKGNTPLDGNTNSNNTPIAAKQQSAKGTKSQNEQNKPESKPVECNLCHRKFKNVPALNGHMRLHGGYFKKENDAKKWEKKESNGPQLTTASISVRALIEEKIIQKRTTALNGIAKLNPASQGILKPKLRQNENLSSKTNESKDTPTTNGYQAKASSFALPAAPTQQQQILRSINAANTVRRTNVKEEHYNSSLHEETLIFNELLLKRVNQKSMKRASSDPGTTSNNIQSPQIDVNFSPENAYLDVFSNQNCQYFSNNLADEMFQSVRDSESMLLTNVDTNTELNNLSQIQNSDFQTINLEEYQNDLQHQQDLQAVLNSPLPVSLAEFSYMRTENAITNNDQTIAYSHARSPLPSPSFTYPTPPASQEGQSPSFGQVTTVVRRNQVTSPLSTAFYSSGMSSPGAVEAALNEVLPMDVNQNVYPSPFSPSTLTVTPEPSPVSLSTPPFSSQGDLYQPHSHEADDALLANQREFEETYKFIESERDIYERAVQQYQSVILNCARVMENNDSAYDPGDAATITIESGCGRNVILRTGDKENITLYAAADDSADDRCHITFHPEDQTNVAKTTTLHAAIDGAATVAAAAYDNRDDMNFRGGADFNFNGADCKGSLFYDKDVSTFHVYAENKDDITVHSEDGDRIILRSNDGDDMIIHDRYNVAAAGHAFHAEENNNYEHQTFDSVTEGEGGERQADDVTLHIADAKHGRKLTYARTAVKDGQPTFIVNTSPRVTAAGTIVNSRKRHMMDDRKHKFPQGSRLRVHRHASHMLHYTPCPMLNPLRNSTGLYWQACSATITNNQKREEEFGREVPKNEMLIESDEDPHINIGAHFQAVIEPRRKNPHPGKLTVHEDLLWEPATKPRIMDNELDMYLEFACCAALPGGGRNKEYALHILHLCQGNIHEAVLKLMQPKLHVPSNHPLLIYPYPDNDAWHSEEIEIFQQSIVKFDKNFTRIARHIETKTAKQCVQFYYLWKKACPEEYKKYRFDWRRNRDLNFDKTTTVIPVSNLNVASEVDITPTASDARPFACEFPECLARFNSRAALNGHNRIHGGSADRLRMVTPTSVTCVNNTCSSDTIGEFPCKLCGKVFSKIKSRSAHMKSHRPTEADHKKPKMEIK